MPFKIITLPFDPNKECFLEDNLNQFALNKRIKSWRSEFFIRQEKAYWTVFLEYEVVLSKEPDNLSNLSEPQQLLFKKLREWRKEVADQAGVPPYIVATNSQLLEIVTRSPKTIESLKMIRGFGQKKIAKYGRELVALVSKFYGDNSHE